MPTEITNPATQTCPIEGPFKTAVSRTNNGFCDFSTHFVTDPNNTDPNNFFYSNPKVVNKIAAFRYSSLVGAFGVNLTETGLGGLGHTSPMFAVVGMGAMNALPTQYATTVYVELLQY